MITHTVEIMQLIWWAEDCIQSNERMKGRRIIRVIGKMLVRRAKEG